MYAAETFPTHCRHWRQYRKLSQLDLALEANVSQRHISWLETGRSQPSREMVIRLSEAMDVPLRERNNLLRAAGFAGMYSEHDLDAPEMQSAMDALQHVLAHHQPFPAIVVDRFWNILMLNPAAEMLFGLVEVTDAFIADMGEQGRRNLAALTVHPGGIRPNIANWAQAGPAFIQRLKREAAASGDQQHQQRLQSLLAYISDDETLAAVDNVELLPLLPLELEQGELRLSLISVISTFGTAQDITADELRLEAFYPADDATRAFFTAVAAQ